MTSSKPQKIVRFPRKAFPPAHVSEKSLSRVIENINKSYRKSHPDGVVKPLEESIFAKPQGYVSSGIFPLDLIVGRGRGFPPGIVEVFGKKGSAKSAIGDETLAAAQHQDFYTGLFPMEFSVNYDRLRQVGIDEKKLMVFEEAETIEDVYEQIRKTVITIRKFDKTTPIIFVWDTIASTPSRRELEAPEGLDDTAMGVNARLMSALFKRLVGFLFKNHVLLIGINQTRENIGQRFGNKEITSGGKALGFYAWVQLRTYVEKHIRRGANSIGLMCVVECVKNKVAPPFRKCRIPLYFDHGIDKPKAVFEYLVDNGFIKVHGEAYRYNGDLVSPRTFAKYYAAHHAEIRTRLRKFVQPENKETAIGD
jgi:recombination protein RecA